MANAVIAVQRFGPETYTVSPAATSPNNITGGRLVEFDGANPGTVKLAVVDSTKWLGVALYDGLPTFTTDTTDASGYPGITTAFVPPEIAVAFIGTFKLTATAAALSQGDVVYAGAGGLIQKATTTGRPVGIVTQPGGIAASGTGWVRFF